MRECTRRTPERQKEKKHTHIHVLNDESEPKHTLICGDYEPWNYTKKKYLAQQNAKWRTIIFNCNAIIYTFQAHKSLYLFFSFYQATEQLQNEFNYWIQRQIRDATSKVIISGYLRWREEKKKKRSIAEQFIAWRNANEFVFFLLCRFFVVVKMQIKHILMPILAENVVKCVAHVMRIRPAAKFIALYNFFLFLLFYLLNFMQSISFHQLWEFQHIFDSLLRLVLQFFRPILTSTVVFFSLDADAVELLVLFLFSFSCQRLKKKNESS